MRFHKDTRKAWKRSSVMAFRSCVVLLMLAGALCGSARAWGPPLLTGPEVSGSKPETLVRWDYTGRLIEVGASAEEAAIELLDLSEEARRRVAEILAERAAIFDRVVLESFELFGRIQTAEAENNAVAMREALAEFAERLSPLTRRGSLREELYVALPREQAIRFAQLVDEYDRALIEDARRAAEQMGEKFNPIEAAFQIRGEALVKAIERSFERTTQADEKEFDELLRKLDLKPESEQLIRARAIEFAQKTNLNPTKGQQLLFIVRVLSELEPDERIKAVRGVIRINREQRQAERAMESEMQGRD